ncbi:MAG: MFS transporter [Paraclostridium sordellii]
MDNSRILKNNKLWNKNFTLLWQGQLVSCLGDAFYSIALGFWVLDKTGSSAIMGILMAAVSIPRVIIGPFAGVIVDRFDRKNLYF